MIYPLQLSSALLIFGLSVVIVPTFSNKVKGIAWSQDPRCNHHCLKWMKINVQVMIGHANLRVMHWINWKKHRMNIKMSELGVVKNWIYFKVIPMKCSKFSKAWHSIDKFKRQKFNYWSLSKTILTLLLYFRTAKLMKAFHSIDFFVARLIASQIEIYANCSNCFVKILTNCFGLRKS